MGLKEGYFTLRGESGADDAERSLVALGPDHQNDTTRDWTNRDETILVLRMLLVEDLEAVDARKQECSCFLERQPVLLLVRAVLRLIPGYSHLSHKTTPLAE